MPLKAGARLGPYEILASLGARGMGEVWRARDTRLGREVAVKVLPPGFAESERFRERFAREARAISSLNHPHICTVHDVGTAGGDGEGPPSEDGAAGSAEPAASAPTFHYLVMELLEGEPLVERLRKGPLPLHEVLAVGGQIASALDAAHRRGIVHRDLKPGNVVLTRAGAKLLDFGLAKTASEAPGPLGGLTSLPTEEKPLTEEGTILGTFLYMAPEQLEGQEADARTDIWALGALLYEMATGRRAFQAETKTSLIAAIVSSQPEPISSLAPMSPPALDHVVRKCLEKDPDDRWQSAHDIASELQWIREAGSRAGVAPPLARRRASRERLAWLAATALLVATVALLLAWPRRAPQPEKLVAAGIAPPPGTSLVPFDDLGLALSPDGTRLAFVAHEGGGRRRVWIRDLGSFAATPLAGSEGASYPFWSPDGLHLGFFARGKLQRVDLRGGSPQTLANAPSGRGGSWSEHDLIAYAPEIWTSIFAVPANGGTPRPLTEYDPATENGHRWPVFLPGGRHFVYVSLVRAPSRPDLGRLELASLDGGPATVLVEDSTNAAYVPGFLVHGRSNSLFAQPFDLGELAIAGRPVPLVDRDVALWGPKRLAVFTASGDGAIVYLPDVERTSLLQWYDRAGRTLETIGEPAFQPSASLSPDGTKIAVLRSDSPETPLDLWVHDLAVGRASRLTFGGEAEGPGYNPAWSPDGRRIAFACRLEGLSNLCVKALGQAGETEELVATPNFTGTGSFSPDGSRFYFEQPGTWLTK